LRTLSHSGAHRLSTVAGTGVEGGAGVPLANMVDMVGGWGV